MVHNGRSKGNRFQNKSIYALHRVPHFLEHFVYIAQNQNEINERHAKKNREERDGDGEDDVERGLRIGEHGGECQMLDGKWQMCMENVKCIVTILL